MLLLPLIPVPLPLCSHQSFLSFHTSSPAQQATFPSEATQRQGREGYMHLFQVIVIVEGQMDCTVWQLQIPQSRGSQWSNRERCIHLSSPGTEEAQLLVPEYCSSHHQGHCHFRAPAAIMSKANTDPTHLCCPQSQGCSSPRQRHGRNWENVSLPLSRASSPLLR